MSLFCSEDSDYGECCRSSYLGKRDDIVDYEGNRFKDVGCSGYLSSSPLMALFDSVGCDKVRQHQGPTSAFSFSMDSCCLQSEDTENGGNNDDVRGRTSPSVVDCAAATTTTLLLHQHLGSITGGGVEDSATTPAHQGTTEGSCILPDFSSSPFSPLLLRCSPQSQRGDVALSPGFTLPAMMVGQEGAYHCDHCLEGDIVDYSDENNVPPSSNNSAVSAISVCSNRTIAPPPPLQQQLGVHNSSDPNIAAEERSDDELGRVRLTQLAGDRSRPHHHQHLQQQQPANNANNNATSAVILQPPAPCCDKVGPPMTKLEEQTREIVYGRELPPPNDQTALPIHPFGGRTTSLPLGGEASSCLSPCSVYSRANSAMCETTSATTTTPSSWTRKGRSSKGCTASQRPERCGPGRPPVDTSNYKCEICQVRETPQWRYAGHLRVCNACSLKIRRKTKATFAAAASLDNDGSPSNTILLNSGNSMMSANPQQQPELLKKITNARLGEDGKHSKQLLLDGCATVIKRKRSSPSITSTNRYRSDCSSSFLRGSKKNGVVVDGSTAGASTRFSTSLLRNPLAAACATPTSLLNAYKTTTTVAAPASLLNYDVSRHHPVFRFLSHRNAIEAATVDPSTCLGLNPLPLQGEEEDDGIRPTNLCFSKK